MGGTEEGKERGRGEGEERCVLRIRKKRRRRREISCKKKAGTRSAREE